MSASEAAAIARNQGLSDQLTEQITGVRGETAAQIEGINERLTDRIDVLMSNKQANSLTLLLKNEQS